MGQPGRLRSRIPAAVVFDMDGLLLDTERRYEEAFVAACGELGFTVAQETYLRCLGTDAATTRAILGKALGHPDRYAALERRWLDLYDKVANARPAEPKRGALDLLDALRRHRIPTGLATSTARSEAVHHLRQAGLLGEFSCLICGGETPRGKPHPDPYLAASAALGMPPAACWALEDSDNGVRSAHAAGLTVFQVPDVLRPSSEVLRLGHHVAEDLFEVLDFLLSALDRGQNC